MTLASRVAFDALWHKAGKGAYLRFVIVRGWPRHDKDDVLICNEVTSSAAYVIETYCLRWPLEETFHWASPSSASKTHRTEPSRRCRGRPPLALWCYSLVIYWYLTGGEKSRGTSIATLPW